MCEKIKILYLLPSLRKTSPISGTLALIKYIDHKRCDITVSCLDELPKENNSIVEELNKLNVKIKPLNIPGWHGLLKIKSVRKFIDAEHFDIVHSYGIRPDIINALAYKKTVSLTSVREITNNGYRLQCTPIISDIISSIRIRFLKKIDYVIVISKAIEDYLTKKKLDVTKICCIPNFIDLNWSNTGHQLTRKEGNFNSEFFNIGYVGSLNSLKRVDWIVRAIADLIKKHTDLKITLHLVGDGPLSSKLKALTNKFGINDHVEFYGHVNNVAPIMEKLDLVIMASKSEGIPRALMEAMSMGKTCVGPAIGGVDELIKDGITGYLFAPDSYEDLVKKLEDVVIEKRFLNPLKISEYIKNNFDAKKGAKRTFELYEQLTATS